MSDTFLLRAGSRAGSWIDGGFSEESRTGGSVICVGIGQNDLRFGVVDCGTDISSTDEFL